MRLLKQFIQEFLPLFIIIGFMINADAYKTYAQLLPSGLKHTNDMIFLKVDGKSREKLGVVPGYAKHLAGSYDPQHKVLAMIMVDLDSSTMHLN